MFITYHLLLYLLTDFWKCILYESENVIFTEEKRFQMVDKDKNKLDRLQWESNPDLCKGCTVPSLGVLWTHNNNCPDFQLALLPLWIEHHVQSSQRSRFDSWYDFFSGLYQPLRLFIQQWQPHSRLFIFSWKFLKLDLFHVFLVNPVFVTPFVIKGNG